MLEPELELKPELGLPEPLLVGWLDAVHLVGLDAEAVVVADSVALELLLEATHTRRLTSRPRWRRWRWVSRERPRWHKC